LKLVIEGKTKRVFERPDGNLEFHFKDDATGYIDCLLYTSPSPRD